jgi:NAD(P)-dependent dehydrogenase (short-subunit alcohol dehydrogenase family)
MHGMKLKNKIIIITGGSGLLGRAYIDYLNNEKANVINADINCEKNIERGEYTCDITDSNSTDELIDEVVKRFGRIDGLVNNAYPRTKDWGTDFEKVPEESWRMNIDMQMNSYIFLSRKVLNVMVKQKSGSIVNLGSIYGIVGPDFTVYDNTTMGNSAEYAAIKGGIVNITRYLASYYGRHNIRLNCVSPGGIFDNQDEIFVKQYEHKVPLRRMGRPDDIAPVIAFLLSDDAKYITGQNIAVDGGWTCI